MSQDEAYIKAGYKENRSNAARLSTNELIVSRVEELQSKMAEKAVWTAADRLAMLHEIAIANKSKDPRVAVSALNEANKMQGSHSPAKFDHSSTDGTMTPPRVIEFTAPTVNKG